MKLHIGSRVLLLIVFKFSVWSNCFGQHTDYVDSSQTQVLADTGKNYWLPDVKSRRWSKTSNKLFSAQLGLVPILDYNINIQDNTSEQQVGKQDSRFDIRSARMMVRGKINFKRAWSYLLSVEYKGLDRTEDMPAFGFTDIKLVIPVSKNSELWVGQIKETFSYEMVGDAANLPHQERLLNPFFVSRNNGIQYRQFLLNNRMTISGGWYNKWPFNGRSFAESPNTFTARITGLPKWEKNGKQFMHTGIAVRYAEADNNTLRLKGKNESNVSTNYVDTKNFEGTHQWNLGIEQLWSLENFSVLMEYVHNWSKATTGTEQFRGYYITSSYIISGEQRPYDMKAAYARRVKPDNKSGAWEVWFRIGRVNLDSRNIKGGINSRGTLGLNWWASQSWKLGFNYGISNLLKDESIGITNSFQWRIQWIL
ncbi:MAG: porin [Chitinophagaceae bacterium]|nr:porin [Chitinophagaceae bacterium]